MRWIIQKDIFPDENIIKLKDILNKKNISFIESHFSLLQKEKEKDNLKTILESSDKTLFFYGGIQYLKYLQKINKLNKSFKFINFCNWPKFDYVWYSSMYPEPSLLNGINLFHICDLFSENKYKLKKEIFDKYSIDDKIFIRPNKGDKSFTGQVISYDQWDSFLEFIKPQIDLKFDIVFISSPKKIYEEYRFIIYNKEVITGSQYFKNGEIFISSKYPKSAMNFAEIISKKWGPHIIYVMDIACIEKEVFKLIEINSINCSAWYDSDNVKITKGIYDAAKKERS